MEQLYQPTPHTAARSHDEPVLCCWFCGYELFASDLPAQNFSCPECGKINLPNDPHCSPYVKKRWPHPVLVALLIGWPGLVVGGLVCVAFSLDPVIGAILALLVLPQCVLWPISITESLLHLRVPGMSRRASHRLFLLGGVVLNLGVAVLLPWLFVRFG